MWLQVSRMVNVTAYVFADHLRGTPFLNWWFRAMVSFCLVFCQLQDLCSGIPGVRSIIQTHGYRR